jgi:hypothetical protein
MSSVTITRENSDGIDQAAAERNARQRQVLLIATWRIKYGTSPAPDQATIEPRLSSTTASTALPTDCGQSVHGRAGRTRSNRAGFEIRTYRLCQRVLMFHQFAELGDTPCLVSPRIFTTCTKGA